MAQHYLLFSQVVSRLQPPEEAWLTRELEAVYVFDGTEYTDKTLPDDLDPLDADFQGCRNNRDLPGCDPEDDTGAGFEYAFDDDGSPNGWGRHLWMYAEEGADVNRVAHLVQKFLRTFRPDEHWALTYATTCSKPRVGEFGGGAVFVTARQIKWMDAYDFVESERKMLHGSPPLSSASDLSQV